MATNTDIHGEGCFNTSSKCVICGKTKNEIVLKHNCPEMEKADFLSVEPCGDCLLELIENNGILLIELIDSTQSLQCVVITEESFLYLFQPIKVPETRTRVTNPSTITDLLEKLNQASKNTQ